MEPTEEQRKMVREFMEQSIAMTPKSQDISAFDLAADCAYSLDLCEMCEINGDKTFIPIYIVKIAEELFSNEVG